MDNHKPSKDQGLPSFERLTLNETEDKTMPAALVDDADITKRRVVNDYSSYKPLSTEPGKEQIRLLQVLPSNNDDDDDEELVCVLFDVPATGDHRIVYIALSYCWGDMTRQRTINLVHHRVDDGEKKIVKNGEGDILPGGDETLVSVDTSTQQTFNVTESLYQALKSLRKAAPRLRENFPILDHQPVWIDALCINQSDMEERSSQVGMMGSIYSRAWFVFIWLGDNEDIMRGLNLIQAMINLLQDTWGSEFDMLDPKDEHIRSLFDAKYQLDGELLDPESCFQILERLFAHPYFRRIWVLQEATINIRQTWIHVTKAQVPWVWIIVADRFQSLWRKVYYTAQTAKLPLIWAEILKAQATHVRAQLDEDDSNSTNRKSEKTTTAGFVVSLYTLFINTYELFDASDLRDKLYALLELAIETRSGPAAAALSSPGRPLLTPDYGKTVSQVFSEFTHWCILRTGDLNMLSLLAGGPRRLMPEDAARFHTTADGGIPESCLDARAHPSWAIWPTTGGFWTVSSLLKAQNAGGYTFDLASHRKVQLWHLDTHPLIDLPETLSRQFLSLGGKTISAVKSVNRMPLRCFAHDKDEQNSFTKAQWATEEMQKEMEKHAKTYRLCLTHPYESERSMLEGGLAPLWYIINRETTEGTVLGDEVVDVGEQQWLGRPGSRYENKHELMLRDFLETLLLSPVYRGEDSMTWNNEDEGIPDGPWNDPIVATSFAMFWAQNDPHFSYLPPRLGKFLEDAMFARGIPREKVFPFLFLGHGKCFFITEDDRMGLCPPETRPGDLIVALYGSHVPFVVRPLRSEEHVYDEENAWTFRGHERLRNESYRFIGECYVHERMSKAFLDENDEALGDVEVFNLC